MTDRPIIMSAPMVRALLESRKTQTRRKAWQPFFVTEPFAGAIPRDVVVMAEEGVFRPAIWQKAKPGDRLWVREKHWCVELEGGGIGAPYLVYDEEWSNGLPCPTEERIWLGPPYYDDKDPKEIKWGPRPSIHMPRWASRLTLVVTETRRDRLRHITREDARAEGFEPLADGGDERHAFLDYWNELHGPNATDANPEVVALTFTVHQRNIDQMESAA